MASLSLDVDALLGAAAHDDPTGKPLQQIHELRDRCQEVESALSYTRRVVQGRLDIAGSELEARRHGGGSSGAGELIAQLPSLLAERGGQGSGAMARPPQDLEPPELTAEFLVRVDAVGGPADLGRVHELSDVELEDLVAALEGLEQELSAERQRLHGILDGLQAEVVRQYRDGVARVDDLLT